MELFIGALDLSDKAKFDFAALQIELHAPEKPYELQSLIRAGAVIYFSHSMFIWRLYKSSRRDRVETFYHSHADILYIYF